MARKKIWQFCTPFFYAAYLMRFQHQRYASSWQTKGTPLQQLLQRYSIEVLPKVVAEIPSVQTLLPLGTQVYVAHIENTPVSDMIAATKTLSEQGMEPVPHIPARLMENKSTLQNLVCRYQQEAQVTQALLIAGGRSEPLGDFQSSFQLLQTGCFDDFDKLHFAGHPEGHSHMSDLELVDVLLAKQQYCASQDIEGIIVTQFGFDAERIWNWSQQLYQNGIVLPIHVGVAGPTRLDQLLRYAWKCGVGPSLKVLQEQKSSAVATLLMNPWYEPTNLLETLAEKSQLIAESNDEILHRPEDSQRISRIEQIHFFPFGGLVRTAQWANHHSGLLAASP